MVQGLIYSTEIELETDLFEKLLFGYFYSRRIGEIFMI